MGLFGNKTQVAVAQYSEKLMRLEQSLDDIPPIQDFKIDPYSANFRGELRRYSLILQAYQVRYMPVLARYEQYETELKSQIAQLEQFCIETDDERRRYSFRGSILVAQQELAIVQMRQQSMQDQNATIRQSLDVIEEMDRQQRAQELIRLQGQLRKIDKSFHSNTKEA